MRPTDVHKVANTKQVATAASLGLSPGVVMDSPGGRPMIVRFTNVAWRVHMPHGTGSIHMPNMTFQGLPPLLPPASMPHESIMQAMIVGGYRGL